MEMRAGGGEPGDLTVMSGEVLLDHAEALAVLQRKCEVEIFKTALQHAYLHDPQTLDPAESVRPGREKARRLGGPGTPRVTEFAAAALAVRLRVSTVSAAMLMADALDVAHRLPQLWARVQDATVRVHLARLVARKTRDLTVEQAAYVDSRVGPHADGRVTWTRFQALVDGAVTAADAEATAVREEKAARAQVARPTRVDTSAGDGGDHGMRGFYIRAPFATVAVFDAAVQRIADILEHLGDTDPVDQRRVKALLVLARPDHAADLITAYQTWRDRPHDPAELPGGVVSTSSTDEGQVVSTSSTHEGGVVSTSSTHEGGVVSTSSTDEVGVVSTSSTDEGGVVSTSSTDEGCSTDVRGGPKPVVDWAGLLPRVVINVHTYAGADSEDVVRVEGCGAMSLAWVRDHLTLSAQVTVKPVLDLAGQAPVDAYEIPERHRQAVQLMTPADTFPYSTSLTPRQIDHTDAFRHGPAAEGAGQSRIGNYGPLTTPHHRVKTHGRWQVRQPFPGIYLWRDPTGHHYLVDHTGTQAIGGAA